MATAATMNSGPGKPLLRGWSHAVASLVACVATVALLLRGGHDSMRLASLLVYGLSLIAAYTASALYHLGPWQGRARTLARAVDHASIFILIAGTYTPFCVNVLSGSLRPTMLI